MYVITFKMNGKPGCKLEIAQTLEGRVNKLEKVDDCTRAEIYRDYFKTTASGGGRGVKPV